MDKFNKTVLAIHAHPDDTESFCSGTLALLKEKGYTIVLATMTPGGMGGVASNEEETARIRKEEARRAAAVLDAEYYCLEQRDGYVFDTVDVRIKVTSLIRKVGAGIVITHLPFDYHSDHRATCSIVEAAAMLANLKNVPTEELPANTIPILYHSEPFGFTDTLGRPVPDPSFFIDISSTSEKKREMLSFHESQKELMNHMYGIVDFFKDTRENDEKIGKIAGVSRAEAFWQHLGAGFPREPLIQSVLKEYRRYKRNEQ